MSLSTSGADLRIKIPKPPLQKNGALLIRRPASGEGGRIRARSSQCQCRFARQDRMLWNSVFLSSTFIRKWSSNLGSNMQCVAVVSFCKAMVYGELRCHHDDLWSVLSRHAGTGGHHSPAQSRVLCSSLIATYEYSLITVRADWQMFVDLQLSGTHMQWAWRTICCSMGIDTGSHP